MCRGSESCKCDFAVGATVLKMALRGEITGAAFSIVGEALAKARGDLVSQSDQMALLGKEACHLTETGGEPLSQALARLEVGAPALHADLLRWGKDSGLLVLAKGGEGFRAEPGASRKLGRYVEAWIQGYVRGIDTVMSMFKR